MASFDGSTMHLAKGMGLVSEVFGGRDLSDLPGDSAIGHVRYSTSGSSLARNAGPILAATQHGEVALGHNGNLVNCGDLRDELEQQGAIFSTTTDSEVILHLFARSTQSEPVDALVESLQRLQGAFSLVVLHAGLLVGVRDPWGFRPLVLGELDGSPVLASETCALDLLKAKYVREIAPGEVVVISLEGMRSLFPFPKARPVPCIFEYVYFARPDSDLFGQVVFPVRQAMGRTLAREQPAEADIVVPVPDSGLAAAMGYAEESGHPPRVGAHQEPLRGPDLHRPPAVRARHLGAPQAQRRPGPPAGQAGGPGGRLAGPGHHLAQDRPPRPGCRGRGGAPAPLQPAHRQPLRLRHRHARALGAPGGQPGPGRHHRLRGGRLGGLPERGGHARGRGPGPRGRLPRLFRGTLPRTIQRDAAETAALFEKERR